MRREAGREEWVTRAGDCGLREVMGGYMGEGIDKDRKVWRAKVARKKKKKKKKKKVAK